MINSLLVENLVLIERTQVDFQAGLTAITGETGSGKTALIEALRLILGERAEISKVRKGAEKARIQGVFSLENALLRPLFEESGVSFPDGEDLVLVREISSTGKGKAFASGQQVPVSFLQKIAPYLVDFIGQHAQIALKASHNQRIFLDTFAEVDLSSFQMALAREKQLTRDLEKLFADKNKSAQEYSALKEQIQELQEANIQEKEAEELFEEYALRSNASELLSYAEGAMRAISVSRESGAALQLTLKKIQKLSEELNETAQMAEESLLLFQEIELALQSFQSKLESDPNRLVYLEERLGLIEKLQKKYGKNLSQAMQSLVEKERAIDTLDEREEQLAKELLLAKEMTDQEALRITKMREKGAYTLATKLSHSLHELNMPNAEIHIDLQPAHRTNEGDEEIHFLLRANKGEQITLVKEGSSGGELSRLLFAMKIAFAEKSQPPTMVFDEIDANVGGQTATKMAALLQELSKGRQILCITHFPQVARFAEHHLCVSKTETERRTEGHITSLSKEEREAELSRMLGN